MATTAWVDVERFSVIKLGELKGDATTAREDIERASVKQGESLQLGERRKSL